MSKVLYIKANAKPEGQSRTFQVSDAFVESYKKAHPGDEVVVLDLYREGIRFLSVEDVMMHATGTENPQEHPVLKYAFQFLNADKYIFAEPLWNLGIPAILKAYIDYITINTVTFKYTIDGPVGLCPAGQPAARCGAAVDRAGACRLCHPVRHPQPGRR